MGDGSAVDIVADIAVAEAKYEEMGMANAGPQEVSWDDKSAMVQKARQAAWEAALKDALSIEATRDRAKASTSSEGADAGASPAPMQS